MLRLSKGRDSMRRGRKLRSRTSINYTIGVLVATICFMGVGYAALQSSILVNGDATIKGNTWSIYIKELYQLTSDTADTGKGEPVSTGGTLENLTGVGVSPDGSPRTVSFSTTIDRPGQTAYYKVKIVNAGTLDAILDSISLRVTAPDGTVLSNSKTGHAEDTYITVDINPSTATTPLVGGENKVKTFIITIGYNDLDNSTLFSIDKTYTINIEWNYVQYNQ